jgi:hypothetical protein
LPALSFEGLPPSAARACPCVLLVFANILDCEAAAPFSCVVTPNPAAPLADAERAPGSTVSRAREISEGSAFSLFVGARYIVPGKHPWRDLHHPPRRNRRRHPERSGPCLWFCAKRPATQSKDLSSISSLRHIRQRFFLRRDAALLRAEDMLGVTSAVHRPRTDAPRPTAHLVTCLWRRNPSPWKLR